MKNTTFIILVCLNLHLSFELVGATKIDQVPMYGGLDRQADPTLAAGDEAFITKVIKRYGDKRSASEAFVDQAFRFFFNNDDTYAMRRFNQAWLLDDSNPEVYHGFGAMLLRQDKDCEAMDMLKRALDLDWQGRWINKPGYLADLGYVATLCLGYEGDDTKDVSPEHREQIDGWFTEAAKLEISNPYVYQKWWQTLYHQRDYAGAWAKIDELKQMGFKPEKDVLKLLKKQMRKPKKKK